MVSTLLLVTLRLIALASPFTFRHAVTTSRVLPFILLSWLCGITLCVVDLELWQVADNESRLGYWIVFLSILLISLILALSSLLPLRAGASYRQATNSIVVLAVLNFFCYGAFGAFNVGTTLYCGSGYYPIWVLEVFCNPETFYSIIYIFPTVYSLGNAIVISRGSRVKEEMALWEGELGCWRRRVCCRGEDDEEGCILDNPAADQSMGTTTTGLDVDYKSADGIPRVNSRL